MSAARRSRLRLGLAGLGVASTYSLPEIANHDKVRLVAAADVRPIARERFVERFGAPAYGSVEELCTDPRVDVVYILTPNYLHARHALTAINAGKHVIVDKPMAVDLAQASELVDAAERRGRYLLVGHTQSLDPAVKAMADFVASGRLGRPLMVHAWCYSDWLYRPRAAYELDASLGEGLVMRQGPVQLDIVRMLGGGMVKTVRASVSRVDQARTLDGSYCAYIEFDGSCVATAVYSSYGYFDVSELTFGIDIQGFPARPSAHAETRRRSLGFRDRRAEDSHKEATRFGGDLARDPVMGRTRARRRHAFFGITLATCEGGDIRQTPTGFRVYGPDGPTEYQVQAGDQYSRRFTSSELDMLHDAWVHEKPLPSHDGRWGRATLEACLAILESASTGRSVGLAYQVPYRRVGAGP